MKRPRDPFSLPILALLAAFLAPPSATAQSFGRNKVQYDTFEWQVLVTDHLEIHFYPEEEALARRAADYGEAACADLDGALGHELSKKIPVVVYGSHYHFRQNNVTPGLVDESTGGFTEIFRTRVVLPYSGSEPQFRHVVRHELVHAYMFDMLYGGPVRSLFVLQHAFGIPLWFAEGIAEYWSNEWDSEAEMMIRDAAVSGTLPPFHEIYGGYFVYKAGWSAVAYLVQRHGEDVLRDVVAALRETRDVHAAIKKVTGEDVAPIAEDWLKDVRKATWPTVAHLDEPEKWARPLAQPLPDGAKPMRADGCVSPSGDRVVFLSDRSGTPDLWLAEIEGKEEPRVLVRGARGGEFESLHPLRSSVGWSPDEKLVAVAAQKGARDALYVMEVDGGAVAFEHVPDLDALERPDWSPVDARVVFTGMKNGQVDLYTMDVDGANLTQLTDDLWEERGPRWSPDGRTIAFASDRADSTGMDVWLLDVETGELEPLRLARGDQWDPAWSPDGASVFHVSDEQGTRDLVRTSLDGGATRRLTALLGGADSPSIARQGGRLVFTALHEGTFDLFVVDDADTLQDVAAPPVELPRRPWAVAGSDSTEAAPADTTAVTSIEPELAEYDPRFRPEWITGALSFDGRGLSAAVQTMVGDVLGDHRIYVSARVFRSLSDSDAIVSYAWLPRRFDFGLSAFHIKDFLHDRRTTLGQPIGEEGGRAWFSERQRGVMGTVSYPFHTFRRVSLDLTALDIERIVYDGAGLFGADRAEIGRTRSRVLMPRWSHVFDNTLWAWTGPIQGSRWLFALQQAIPVGGDDISYGTVMADLRGYARRRERYVFAFRAMGASSFGGDPQRFFLGGPNTLRGWGIQQFGARNVALASGEFRYPFLDYVKLGWPFRSAFGGVRGNLFVDVGAAFDRPGRFRLSGDAGMGPGGLDDLKIGFGVGARMRFAFLPMRFDVGWPTDLSRVGPPVWYFTIGPEY
jgi:Tol biopolymer transport system component